MSFKDLSSFVPSKINPERGTLLLSEPMLPDPFFRRAVVLLAEHNEEGSFGLILNKPISVHADEIVKDFPISEIPVFMGGPVNTDSIFFIHRMGEIIPGSLEITKDIFWGGDVQVVLDMLENKILHSADIRFFVGYAGWQADQLDQELEEESWIVSNADPNLAFNDADNTLWEKIVKLMGKNYESWISFPEDPLDN